MIFLLPAPQPHFKIWAATRRCHPHLGVLPASIKAIRTLLQLRLPAQLFLICNKLTLKPTITSTGRECLHLGNLLTPAARACPSPSRPALEPRGSPSGVLPGSGFRGILFISGRPQQLGVCPMGSYNNHLKGSEKSREGTVQGRK